MVTWNLSWHLRMFHLKDRQPTVRWFGAYLRLSNCYSERRRRRLPSHPDDGLLASQRPMLVGRFSCANQQISDLCRWLHLLAYGVDYYDLFTILLQELSIDMDEEFLAAVLSFFKFNVPGWDDEKRWVFERGPYTWETVSSYRHPYQATFVIQAWQFRSHRSQGMTTKCILKDSFCSRYK